MTAMTVESIAGTMPWTHVSLGRAIRLQRGYDLPKRLRKRGDFPIVTSSGIEEHHNVAAVRAPGVVTGRYGTIGQVFYVENDFWPLNTTLFVQEFNGNDPRFISFLLRTIDFKSHSGKSGVPGVNRNDLHGLTIDLPPLPEQKAIAKVLSDVDELIQSLERLIAKKRGLKQAAMQQLLTGQTRLPGFSGEWQKSLLGAAITLQRGFDLPKRQRTPGSVPIVTSSGIEDFNATPAVPGPGVVTGRYGTIGQVFFVEEDFWPLNTTLYVRDFHGNDPLFISYFLRRIDFRSHSGKSGVPGVNRNDLHSLVISMPHLEEQRAIADVLSDMDAEITALEARLAKTRDLKQGMMRELLTGRTRLI